MNRSILTLIGLALLASGAHALEVSDGPLLVFTHPEASAADAASIGPNPQGRIEALYVVDPRTSTTPHLVPPRDGTLSVLARPLRNTLLIDYYQRAGLYAVDLASGKDRPLLGEKKTDYVASDGPVIFFVEVVQAGDSGHKLATSPDDPNDEKVVPTQTALLHLYRIDVSTDEAPRQILDDGIETILSVTEKDIWVVTAAREIWQVSKSDSKNRKIMTLPEDWVTTLIHPRFSPDGKRLAMSAVPRNHFFYKRDLLIVDVDSGKSLFEQKQIYVGSDPVSSSIPRLQFSWKDNDTLSFLESIVTRTVGRDKVEGFEQSVDVDAATGKRIREVKQFNTILPSYGRRENQSKKEPAGPRKFGLFERDGQKLYYAGEAYPIVDLDDERGTSPTALELSPDGKWAAYYSQSNAHFVKENGDNPILVDGEARHKFRLINGWVYDMKWLPATGR